jgi:hypothetical protein
VAASRIVSVSSTLCVDLIFALPSSIRLPVLVLRNSQRIRALLSPKKNQFTTPHKESRSTTGDIMRLRRVAGYAIIGLCCLFSSACFSIEQEIFLNADGSGDVVVFISQPHMPEK